MVRRRRPTALQPRPPTPVQEISTVSCHASKQPSLPSAAAQDVVSLQITAVASSPGSHAFRLRERALVWFKAPGCPATGITPSLRQDSTELARIAEEHTIELPSGVYQLGFSWPDVVLPKTPATVPSSSRRGISRRRHAPAKDALFGIFPFDSEAPSVESIGDINADGREDHRVTFSASPTQMGTRVVVSREPPACVRTVFDGVGHVVPLPESNNGWKRLYFLGIRVSGDWRPGLACKDLMVQRGPSRGTSIMKPARSPTARAMPRFVASELTVFSAPSEIQARTPEPRSSPTPHVDLRTGRGTTSASCR